MDPDPFCGIAAYRIAVDAPPADAKRASAHALAIALAYIGLAANDAVQVALLQGERAAATSTVFSANTPPPMR